MMKQLKRILTAILAAFGAFFLRASVRGEGGNFNFRRVFGAVCLSAILGAGNVAFAAGGLPETDERIDVAYTPGSLCHHPWQHDGKGWATVHHLAQKNDSKNMRLLFNRCGGAKVNQKTNDEKKETALHIAAWYGHEAAIRALFLSRQRIEIDILNAEGKTPLHNAAWQGKRVAARMLLRKRANVNARGKDGRTPLHHAGLMGRALMAKLLIEAGADIGAKDKAGLTPLRLAIEHGKGNTAKKLIELGANDAFVKYRDYDGRTNLHHAARDNKPQVIRALVGLGMNINDKDKRRFTPLHIAARYNRKEAARVLLELGADPDAKNIDGRDPMSIVLGYFGGDADVAHLLRYKLYVNYIDDCVAASAEFWRGWCEMRYRFSGFER